MNIADKLQKESDKDYGVGVMIDASQLLEEECKIVSVSPMIDIGLGGGIPEGSWVIISGPEKQGKTATALQICANAQEMGKDVYYYLPEGRLKSRDLSSLHNLDPHNKFKIIRSIKGKIMAAEDFVNHAAKTIKTHPGCVVVLDSGSALCARSELDSEISGTGRAQGPRILASFCRQMGTIVPVQQVILIITQHLIANTSGYGSPFYEDGGRKVQYQVDVKLRGKGAQQWKPSGEEKSIGQVNTWEIKSSALSGIPWTKVQSYLRFGYGIDVETELLHLGVDFGLISQGGAGWYTFEFLEDLKKIQGETKAVNFLKDNPKETQLLHNRIKEMI